jgi:hypothetical protein
MFKKAPKYLFLGQNVFGCILSLILKNYRSFNANIDQFQEKIDSHYFITFYAFWRHKMQFPQ